MPAQTIPAILRIRRGTYTQWENANPVLREGELGLITYGQDKDKFKVGDGHASWNSLPYIIGADGKAADIAISGVTTVSPDLSANVINEGTENEARLHFYIPQGLPGTVVPDITGLSDKETVSHDDLLYIYDSTSGALKKISAGILLDRYAVGDFYVQYPDAASPLEKGLFGTWEVWSHRAVLYGLSSSVPAYANYTQGASYAANAYALYHLSGNDWRLFRAKAAVNNAPQYLDPVMWNVYAPESRVARRYLQALTEDDFPIGHRISGGPYDGMYVTEILVPGGKFPSIEGGLRPAFESGGTQIDRIRNIYGGTVSYLASSSMTLLGGGALVVRHVPSTYGNQIPPGNPDGWDYLDFDASRVVPTGWDNAPENLSCRFWRRVS